MYLFRAPQVRKHCRQFVTANPHPVAEDGSQRRLSDNPYRRANTRLHEEVSTCLLLRLDPKRWLRRQAPWGLSERH